MKYEAIISITMITDDEIELEADAIHDKLAEELNGDLQLTAKSGDDTWAQIHVTGVELK
jgi:hypothetical protein